MIKINLLQTPDQSLNKLRLRAATEKFLSKYRSLSFSKRNLDLGKMVNCQICGLRHRSANVCVQRFAKFEDDTDRTAPGTRNGILGANRFHGRLNRRPNMRGRLLVERTRGLYPLYDSYLEPIEAMKTARTEANRELKAERKEVANRYRSMQKESRRINRQA